MRYFASILFVLVAAVTLRSVAAVLAGGVTELPPHSLTVLQVPLHEAGPQECLDDPSRSHRPRLTSERP